MHSVNETTEDVETNDKRQKTPMCPLVCQPITILSVSDQRAPDVAAAFQVGKNKPLDVLVSSA